MELPRDVAAIRLDNALQLFDEFVRATAQHADAATLRGLERRFAERLQIQPSYWSQIKGRSRQIGERLARQFEQCCGKPGGWMDQAHGSRAQPQSGASQVNDESLQAANDDERFIMGLVLTYYRRHPQRARTRLLDLLGEVLVPAELAAGGVAPPPPARAIDPVRSPTPAPRPSGAKTSAPATDDGRALWLQSQSGVAPLRSKR